MWVQVPPSAPQLNQTHQSNSQSKTTKYQMSEIQIKNIFDKKLKKTYQILCSFLMKFYEKQQIRGGDTPGDFALRSSGIRKNRTGIFTPGKKSLRPIPKSIR